MILNFPTEGGSRSDMRNTLVRAHAVANERRFSVDTTHPDGHVEHVERTGGTSTQHALQGMERAGLGGVVRVRAIEDLEVQRDDEDDDSRWPTTRRFQRSIREAFREWPESALGIETPTVIHTRTPWWRKALRRLIGEQL